MSEREPSTPKLYGHIEEQAAGEELLLHNTRTGEVLALNATAQVVWRAISGAPKAVDAVKALEGAYPATPRDTIERDVAETRRQIQDFIKREDGPEKP